ncbi:MAG: hypothetical protein ACYTF6_06055, partial [Planctomycetota bacterium]
MKISTKAIAALAVVTLLVAGVHADSSQQLLAKWSDMDIAQLTAEGRRLRTKHPSAEGDCRLLAKHAAERYEELAAAGKAEVSEWVEMAVVLGNYFPARAQVALVKDIKAKLIPDAGAVVGLSAEELLEISGALDRLRSPAGSVVATWLTGSQKYQSLSGGTFSRMVYFLRSADRAARGRIAAQIQSSYLKDAEATKSFGLGKWRTIVNALAGYLSSDVRQDWAGRFYAAYVKEPADIGALTWGQSQILEQVLSRLGSGARIAVLPRWIIYSRSWHSCKPHQLVGLLRPLSALGGAGKGARAAIISHVESSLMADAEEIKGASAWTWNELVRYLGGDLSQETKEEWAAKVHSACAGDDALLAALSLEDCKLLKQALSQLGSKDAATLLPRWLEANSSWRSWDAGQIVKLAQGISPASQAGKKARGVLVKHVETKFLADEKAIKAISLPQWQRLVGCFAADLSEQAKAAWAEKLYSTYVGDKKVLASVSVGDCKLLAQVLAQLGSKDAPKILPRWVKVGKSWRSCEPKELAALARELSRLGDAGKQSHAAVVQHLKALLLADVEKAKAEGLKDSLKLIGLLSRDLSAKARAELAGRLSAAYVGDAKVLASLKVEDCRALSQILKQLGSEDARSVLPKWMASSESWRSWKTRELVGLAAELSRLGAAGKEGRKLLLEHVRTKLL